MAFVDPDKSNMYVVISGEGKTGKVSSVKMVFTAPLIEAHPVSIKENASALTTTNMPRGRLVLNMWVIMYAGTDK